MLVETTFYESWRVFFRERIVNYALNVVGTYLRRLATETERVAVRRCICPHRPEARPQRGRRVLQSRCRSPAYDASPMHDWTDATRRDANGAFEYRALRSSSSSSRRAADVGDSSDAIRTSLIGISAKSVVVVAHSVRRRNALVSR